MPGHTEPANGISRITSETSELWRKVVLLADSKLQRPMSGTLTERGRLAAIAAIALLRGRVGRKLLKSTALFSLFFIYEYLVVIELVVAIIVLAQMVYRVLSTFASVSRANNGERQHSVGYPEPAITAATTTCCNTDQRLEDEIQRQLAMAAAAPRPNRSRDCVIVEFPDRQQTLAVPRVFRKAPAVTATRTSTEWNVAPPMLNNCDGHMFRATSTLNQLEKPVIIHMQLPIYVCNLTFWNDIRIIVSTQSSSPAASDYYSTTNNCGVQGCNGNSSSGSPRQLYQIEMWMWVEANKDVVVPRDRKRNGQNFCEECAKSSHSVGRRRFECTNIDGLLEVQKNTFHAGRRITFVNNNLPNGGLNFKFETHLEQTTWPLAAEHGRYADPEDKASQWTSNAAFKQQTMFKMLPLTSPKVENSKVRGSSHRRQRHHGFLGFLDYFKRSRGDNRTQGPLAPTSSCHMEAIYKLEDRSVIQTHNSFPSVQRKAVTT